jgi:hypothetical protein
MKWRGKGEFEGDQYEGEFLEGDIVGKGVYMYANGNRYEGEFTRPCQKHGKGKFSWKDGSIYFGEFRNGLRSGKGKMTWVGGEFNGDCFEGEFLDGDVCGFGTYKYHNGNVYVGNFRAPCVKHGEGIYTWKAGGEFVGMFKDGKRCGQGRMIYRNGNVYEGLYAESKRNGMGVMKEKDGWLIEGNWENNGIFFAKDQLTDPANFVNTPEFKLLNTQVRQVILDSKCTLEATKQFGYVQFMYEVKEEKKTVCVSCASKYYSIDQLNGVPVIFGVALCEHPHEVKE